MNNMQFNDQNQSASQLQNQIIELSLTMILMIFQWKSWIHLNLKKCLASDGPIFLKIHKGTMTRNWTIQHPKRRKKVITTEWHLGLAGIKIKKIYHWHSIRSTFLTGNTQRTAGILAISGEKRNQCPRPRRRLSQWHLWKCEEGLDSRFHRLWRKPNRSGSLCQWAPLCQSRISRNSPNHELTPGFVKIDNLLNINKNGKQTEQTARNGASSRRRRLSGCTSAL